MMAAWWGGNLFAFTLRLAGPCLSGVVPRCGPARDFLFLLIFISYRVSSPFPLFPLRPAALAASTAGARSRSLSLEERSCGESAHHGFSSLDGVTSM